MIGNLFSDFDNDLFGQLRRFESEMDQFLGGRMGPSGIRSMRRGTFPPINVGSTPDRVDVYLFAAGLDPKSLDISIQQNLLAVAGSRRVPVNEAGEYYRRERFSGDFRRIIQLPDDVDPDRVEAKYRDGVLHISVQRREAARPRQITVN
jgi:HSP20 family protein